MILSLNFFTNQKKKNRKNWKLSSFILKKKRKIEKNKKR